MEQFYHLMILLGLCVLFKLGFLPYVDRGGFHNRNYVHKIEIAEDAYWASSDNDEEGVTNQERAEWLIRWLVPGVLFAWIPFVTEWYWWIAATILGTLWTEILERQFDGLGHTIEIITVDTVEYERGEIQRMTRDRSFKGMSVEQLYDFVEKRKPLARFLKKVFL